MKAEEKLWESKANKILNRLQADENSNLDDGDSQDNGNNYPKDSPDNEHDKT